MKGKIDPGHECPSRIADGLTLARRSEDADDKVGDDDANNTPVVDGTTTKVSKQDPRYHDADDA